MLDIVGAVAELLKSDPVIGPTVEGRVFVGRIPHDVVEAEDTFRPRKMVVVRHAGGGEKRDSLRLELQRIDVLCYGETMQDADVVRRAVWSRFVTLSREWVSDVLIHYVNPAGGALASSDPDIVWPIIVQSFIVMAATEA
jgi:hypothetical protein